MKKILPIVAVLGASSLIVGLSSTPTEKKESYIQHINSFQNAVSNFNNINNAQLVSAALTKYTLSIESEIEDAVSETSTNLTNETNEILPNMEEVEDKETIKEDINTEKQEQISTLYSLSSDIEDSCDEYCELKEEITSAILETQNLINKVNNNEIQLTGEQKMFLTEQAQELKRLGRQLSKITTELSFSLTDLNLMMTSSNQDLDNLSLKYLVVLDNLVNGNEMLESGLSSLNLINQMFNMQTKNLPLSNNEGRILYGFQHNDNPPIIKDYSIKENGEIIENQTQENAAIEVTDNNENADKNSNSNIDTYKNTNLNSNLDTYNNTNLPQNIDTFFNTALLDNEFMYGNRGYAYGMNGYNPYLNGYQNNNQNTTNGNNTSNNTQDMQQENNATTNKKRKRLKKNIDTYKDENTPDIKTKLTNIKNAVTGFFSKFKQSDLNEKTENPVYRFDANDNTELNS